MSLSNKLLNIFIAFAMIIAWLPPIYGETSKSITVETWIYNNGVKKITVKLEEKEIKELEKHLIELNNFIDKQDRAGISSEIKFLKDKGLIEGDYNEIYNLLSRDYSDNHRNTSLEGNISNYLCYINAIGSGLMLFTIGQLLYLLAKEGLVLPGIIYFIILIITHSIPFRVLLPLGLIELKNGSISLLGLNGYMHLTTTDEIMVLSLIGFTGIVINFPINSDFVFLFVSGLSLMVTDENVFGYTP